MVEDRDIHNFTLTVNKTQVKSLRGGSKKIVSRRNNWAIRPDIIIIVVPYFKYRIINKQYVYCTNKQSTEKKLIIDIEKLFSISGITSLCFFHFEEK